MIEQWQSYIYLSAGVLMLYDYFLRLDDEIELIWGMSWSLGKFLFLWNQYAGIVIFVTSNFWTLPDTQQLDPPSVLGYYHWVGVGRYLLIACPQIIMGLRVYGLYGHHRAMLCLLVLLFLGQLSFLLGYSCASSTATRNTCMIFNPNLVDYSHIIYIPALIIDGTLVLLVMYKAWPTYTSGFVQPLMRMIARHYVLYFVVVFVLYLVTVITAKVNIDTDYSVPKVLTINDLCAAYALAIPSILANRLLIALRADYYRPGGGSMVSAPIHFNRVSQRTSSTRLDTIASDSFEMSPLYARFF